MPDEIEVETKELRDTITELREEHAKDSRDSGWLRYVSLSTAFLAVIAAIAALEAGALVNEAILSKNEAVLKQAQASDQWAYYQASGVKANTAQYFVALVKGEISKAKEAASYAKDAKKYESKKTAIEVEARKLEAERDHSGAEANELMKRHETFALSVTFTQVAIALSAIAALTKSRVVWYLSSLVGLIGLFFFARGWMVPPPAAHAEVHAIAVSIESTQGRIGAALRRQESPQVSEYSTAQTPSQRAE